MNIIMTTNQNRFNPVCDGKCTRRSFISKSICTSIGVAFSTNLLLAGSSKSVVGMKQEEAIFKELDELVDEYLPKFHTCSQTSFYALNKVFNINADEFVKSLASMPGVASRGETCGAVTGSLLAIAMVYEEDIFDEEMKRLSSEPSYSFCSQFENTYSSTRCRNIIEHVTGKKYNLDKWEDYELLISEGVLIICPAIIKEAVHIAAKIILEKTE
jgi:C_GCAxxG_C_C family probable redox protein